MIPLNVHNFACFAYGIWCMRVKTWKKEYCVHSLIGICNHLLSSSSSTLLLFLFLFLFDFYYNTDSFCQYDAHTMYLLICFIFSNIFIVFTWKRINKSLWLWFYSNCEPLKFIAKWDIFVHFTRQMYVSLLKLNA